jgi:hypothetical protein
LGCLGKGAGEGAEIQKVRFSSVFACSRVLSLAINAHEII